MKLYCKWVVISGALLIWTIKLAIRPYHLLDDQLKFFWGIAPNLIGSFVIPFAVYWFFTGKRFFVTHVVRFYLINDLKMVCISFFLLLVLNEYLQLIPVFGRTFDYFDILFSAVGLCFSTFVFGKLIRKYEFSIG